MNLYVGSTDKNLYAFEVESGKFLWKYPTGGEIYAQPLATNDTVYVAATDGALYAISSDGKLYWKTQLVPADKAPQYKGLRTFTTPLLVVGTIFVPSAYQGTIYAVDMFSGKLTNSYSLGADTQAYHLLTLGNDKKTIFDNAEGIGISAFEYLGQPKWSKQRYVYGPLYQFRDGKLAGFAGSQEIFFDLTTGDISGYGTDFHHNVISIAEERINNATYYTDSSGRVTKESGTGSWAVFPYGFDPLKTGSFVVSLNSNADLGLFLASQNGHVARLDEKDGHIIWDHQYPEEFRQLPLVARINQNTSSEFRVIVISKTGHLYSFDGNGNLLKNDNTSISGEVYQAPVAEIP